MPASITNLEKPKVVVAILNWGLGHATRMIPIIDLLVSKGVNVIIASSGLAGALLRERYSQLSYYELQDYNVKYTKDGAFLTSIMKNWNSVRNAIKTERHELSNLIKMEAADAIISDNRYGCFSDKTPSVIITHQVSPQAPSWLTFLQPIVNSQISRLLNKFHECWIPDYPDQRLSGQLSNHKMLKISSNFIGPLSRFGVVKLKVESQNQWLAILSGPEPQRTILQEKFINACRLENRKGIILAGRPDGKKRKDGNVEIIPHLPDEEFLHMVNQSKFVLMRPGYSSIMDFYQLGKKALLIPTPGQTEQQYLAKIHSRQNCFIVQYQNQIELSKAELDLIKIASPEPMEEGNMLEKNVDQLINKILR